MIATIDKLCPLRKSTEMVNYHFAGNGAVVDTKYKEDFLPCIETECMIWDEDKHTCAIMEVLKSV